MKTIIGGRTETSMLRVLVVDDSETDFVSLKELFKKLHSTRYELDWASTLDEGLSRLGHGQYDVCLLDYSIDNDGGFSFLRSAQILAPSLPIILLSQSLSLDRDIQALRLGAADYLSKSKLQPGFLHRSIRYALERRKSRNQAIRIERHLSLAQNMNSLGELAYGMAQDLADPLLEINRELEFLEQELTGKKKLQQAVQRAKAGCQRANRTIEHVLLFAEQKGHDVEQLSLPTFLQDVFTEIRALLQKGFEVEFVTQIADDQCILGDSKQLRQVLVDLILNAQEMMPNAGTIHCTLDRTIVDTAPAMRPDALLGEYLRISIEDSGVGIPEEHLDRIFDPLFTANHRENTLGLGLPAVAAIMKNHSGWIEIESARDCGTSAKLYFPVATSSAKPGNDCHKNPKVEIQAEKKCKGTVLVIEEQEELGELITLYLAAAGFTSKYFSGAQNAIEWFQKHSDEIDLIILDASLSGMCPIACVQDLRSIAEDMRIAICDVEYGSKAEKLLAAGALKFFQKPNRYPTLVTWVQEILREDSNNRYVT